jgi:hypothetical protein
VRVADRDHELADPQLGRVAELGGVRSSSLTDGEVRRVGADELDAKSPSTNDAVSRREPSTTVRRRDENPSRLSTPLRRRVGCGVRDRGRQAFVDRDHGRSGSAHLVDDELRWHESEGTTRYGCRRAVEVTRDAVLTIRSTGRTS